VLVLLRLSFTGEFGKIFSSFLALAVDAWIAVILPTLLAILSPNQMLKLRIL
jgi:hypothetical protein